MKRQSALFRGITALLLAGLFGLAGQKARAETMLLMAEEPGCPWCMLWNKEVAPIYPKTPEGQAAPLRRIDIRQQAPDGVTLNSRITFTPTFVLVDEGREISRIEGYPGEDFFWGLLGKMLKDAGLPHDRSG